MGHPYEKILRVLFGDMTAFFMASCRCFIGFEMPNFGTLMSRETLRFRPRFFTGLAPVAAIVRRLAVRRILLGALVGSIARLGPAEALERAPRSRCAAFLCELADVDPAADGGNLRRAHVTPGPSPAG